MELALTEVQKITLRDILTTAGLSTRQVEDVFLLLSFKPGRVQKAFYYRACGNTYSKISDFMKEALSSVHWMVNVDCADIKGYLESFNKIV